jgi:hypothetical protein
MIHIVDFIYNISNLFFLKVKKKFFEKQEINKPYL